MQINSTWQNAFRGELISNLRGKSNNFTRQLYIVDITTECVMYSCDMCLHFYKEGAFYGITAQMIDKITYNVCNAMHSVVKEFQPTLWDEVMTKVRELMSDTSRYSALQREVDNYYCRP